MRDAIELEWAGVPSVLVVHDALHGSAAAMSALCGHPGYPCVSFGQPANPTATWSEAEIRGLVDELAPRVISRLRASEPAGLKKC